MGLSFLGRGRAERFLGWQLRGLHILGATLGGAFTGSAVGGIGALLIPAAGRPWVIGAVTFWAIVHSLWRPEQPLGRKWQVPRIWNQTMPPRRRYFLWGALLGCGLATPIIYSGFLVLLGAELIAGPFLGGLAGAVFGGIRQALALVPLLHCRSLSETAAFLPRLRSPFRRLNLMVVVFGGLLLTLAGWR